MSTPLDLKMSEFPLAGPIDLLTDYVAIVRIVSGVPANLLAAVTDIQKANVPDGGGGGGGAVDSVFGRTGNVLAQGGDYNWGQISGTTLPIVSGVNVTNLNASQLASGTIPDARFPAVLPPVSGALLTNINATAIVGTLPPGSFPALTGDVTTTAGSTVTTIGAGKVTNAMLAGGITANKLVGTDIDTVGTITTGVWHGTPIDPAHGGTGLNHALTPGSVVFVGAGGVFAENNAAFFWDNNTARLGLGTATPKTRLDVNGDLLLSAATANLFLKDQATGWQATATTVMQPLAANSIRSTTFTSGLIGWNINALGDAEFNNLSVRGELRASVFKVNELAATAGTFGVFYSASTLTADCTTAATYGASFGFTAKNSDVIATAMLFAIGDIVRMKAYVNFGGLIIGDSWATITARVNNGPTTTYTATLNSGSGGTTFRAGTAVVDYGAAGTGFITLSTDGTVGATPNMTMATHAGAPWSTFTTLVRVGNLNGAYGYNSNVYGFATGQYNAGAWIVVDSTSGVRIGAGTSTTIQLNPDGSGYLANASIHWTTAGVFYVDNSAVIGGWTIAPTKIYSTGVDLNSGTIAGLAFGTPPPTATAPGVPTGTGVWLDRTGLYGLAANVVQVKVDATNGKFIAGNNAVIIDPTGITIQQPNAGTPLFRLADAGVRGFEIRGSLGVNSIQSFGNATNGISGGGGLIITALNSAQTAQITLNLVNTSPTSSSAQLYANTGTFGGFTIGGAGTAAAPSATVDLQGTTGALLLTRLTTTQRDALTPSDGMLIYNSTTAAFNMRAAGAWTAPMIGDANGSLFFPVGANAFFHMPTNQSAYGVVWIADLTGTTAGAIQANSNTTGQYNQLAISIGGSNASAPYSKLYLQSAYYTNAQQLQFFLWSDSGQSFAGINALAGKFNGLIIGSNAQPAASTILQLESTTGALLLSRLTQTQATALTPTDGMVLYNSTSLQFIARAFGQWRGLCLNYSVRVGNSATTYTIPDTTPTPLNYDFAWFDADTTHQNGAMSRLTAKVAGLYLLHASLTFYGNANGYRQISFRLNGAANNLTGALDTKPHATNGCILNISTIWNLAVGDYVEVIAVQTCGVALNIVGSNGGNNYGDHYFSMAKIG